MNFKTIACSSLLLTILLYFPITKVQAEKISQTTLKQLQQTATAKETEGKNIVGTINRTQQVYHFETKSFANDIKALGLQFNSKYYKPSFLMVDSNKAVVTANATQEGLKSFSGATTYENGSYNVIICVTLKPSPTAPPPRANGFQLSCPPETVEIR